MKALDTLFAKSKAELAELSGFYYQLAEAYSNSSDTSIIGVAYRLYANFVCYLRKHNEVPKNLALTDADFKIMLDDLQTLKECKGEDQ